MENDEPRENGMMSPNFLCKDYVFLIDAMV